MKTKEKDLPQPAPRLYLVTPQLELDPNFDQLLIDTLAAADVAAVLFCFAKNDAVIGRLKTLISRVQDKGVAALLRDHPDLVAPCGADGAHMAGFDALKKALPILKPDRIAGAGGLESRHDAMLSAENGADYVMFGEPSPSGQRPSDEAITERVEWWASLFEIPCVAYAASLSEAAAHAAAGADFIAVGDLIFSDPRGPAAAISDVAHRLSAEAVG